MVDPPRHNERQRWYTDCRWYGTGPGGFQVLFQNTGDFGYSEYAINATSLNA